MATIGREAVSQQLQHDSTLSTEVAACTKLFCATLAQLNAISEQQIKALLNIAVTAAEVARALSSSEPEARSRSAAFAKGDELTELAAQLTGATDRIGHRRVSAEGTGAGEEESDQVGGQRPTATTIEAEVFCAKVEANINLAMQNSLADQQALNVLGHAILAQAAVLLFSVAGHDSLNSDEQET